MTISKEGPIKTEMTISKDRLKRPMSVIGTLSFTLYALQHHVAQLGLPQLVRGTLCTYCALH